MATHPMSGWRRLKGQTEKGWGMDGTIGSLLMRGPADNSLSIQASEGLEDWNEKLTFVRHGRDVYPVHRPNVMRPSFVDRVNVGHGEKIDLCRYPLVVTKRIVLQDRMPRNINMA